MPEALQLDPIGFVRTGMALKFDAPHQPNQGADETNTIELEPGKQFELALQDLEGFDRIWLVWWFHKNDTWRPRAMPPRGPAKRRGVFATRSPHRPNPIGLTCVKLLKVEGLTLTVGPLDLVDGTPILDIKPYVPSIDAFPESRPGWIAEIDAQAANALRFEIQVQEPARTQLAWLKQEWNIDFTERAFELLRADPTPHRTRRIIQLKDGRHRIACGPWRLFYQIQNHQVLIQELGKGYSGESLQSEGHEKIPDRDAQLAFSKLNPP